MDLAALQVRDVACGCLAGCHWREALLASHTARHMRAQEHLGPSIDVQGKVVPAMRECARHVFGMAVPRLNPRRFSFCWELLGLDFMIDARGQVCGAAAPPSGDSSAASTPSFRPVRPRAARAGVPHRGEHEPSAVPGGCVPGRPAAPRGGGVRAKGSGPVPAPTTRHACRPGATAWDAPVACVALMLMRSTPCLPRCRRVPMQLPTPLDSFERLDLVQFAASGRRPSDGAGGGSMRAGRALGGVGGGSINRRAPGAQDTSAVADGGRRRRLSEGNGSCNARSAAAVWR